MSDDAPSYFHDAEVEHEGRTVRLPADEARREQSRGNYWHGPGDPSTWLAAALFCAVRARLDLPVPVALTLAARSLGVTEEALRGKLEWHENYMRWHDG